VHLGVLRVNFCVRFLLFFRWLSRGGRGMGLRVLRWDLGCGGAWRPLLLPLGIGARLLARGGLLRWQWSWRRGAALAGHRR
jgi:hypothetical protein